MKLRITPGTLMLSGLLCAACFSAQAAGQANTVSSSKVGIDPATGKLRPLTAAESAALDQAATAAPSSARSNALRGAIPQTDADARATERRMPNGTVARKVPASQMSSVVATRNADGSVSIRHADEGQVPADHAEQGELPSE